MEREKLRGRRPYHKYVCRLCGEEFHQRSWGGVGIRRNLLCVGGLRKVLRAKWQLFAENVRCPLTALM